MIIRGNKRWFVLILVSFLSSFLAYLPYLRFNFYDQMVMLFTETKSIVDMAHVNEFIGNYSLVYAVIAMIGYPFGGYIADKFREKTMILLGSACMAAATIWFAFLPGKTGIMILHVIYGFGIIFMFSSYLKVVRKLGRLEEQGRFFSISESTRAIWQTIVGFMGVALLNSAILSGTTDPVLLGQKWKMMMMIDGGAIILFAGLLVFLLPKDLIGAETEQSGSAQVDEPISIKGVLEVIKMPGLWLISILLFFCFSLYESGSGYLGTYCVNVMGMSTTAASTFAIVRNYIILAASTFIVGFIADKVGSKIKTLGYYLVLGGVTVVLLMLFGHASLVIPVAISSVFAFAFLGMRGIYFATTSEVGIPLRLNGVATGIMSLIMYSPDVFFPKLAGKWLDSYGDAAFNYIWIWTAACAVLGILFAVITYRYAQKLKKQRTEKE